MKRIDQPWLTAPETQAVLDALQVEGAQALFVGGCVRNALIGASVSDLDIATDAVPQTVIRLADKAGLKAIPTGVEHGTVTLVSGGVPHEVTTFRKDVATDGRRAVVAFSTEIAVDAARRDFTMNALYARQDGTVVDPLGGMADLEERRLRFIGDANARIREDYLRSLRYFRFHAWYGDPEGGLDPEALAAIARNLEGLDQLSKERVGSEMMKLLSAADPAPAVAGMRQSGVLNALLPESDDRALGVLIHLEAGSEPDPLRRLAALGGEDVSERLRLSRKQAAQLDVLMREAREMKSAATLAYKYGAATARDVVLARCALMETALPADLETDVEKGAAAKFPIIASDLMPGFQGAELGQALRRLEKRWIASGFTLGRDALLATRDE